MTNFHLKNPNQMSCNNLKEPITIATTTRRHHPKTNPRHSAITTTNQRNCYASGLINGSSKTAYMSGYMDINNASTKNNYLINNGNSNFATTSASVAAANTATTTTPPPRSLFDPSYRRAGGINGGLIVNDGLLNVHHIKSEQFNLPSLLAKQKDIKGI